MVQTVKPGPSGPFILPLRARSIAHEGHIEGCERAQRIVKVARHYIDSAKSRGGDDIKPVFHVEATIFSYVGSDLFAGPIQKVFNWNNENGPATGLDARITCIGLADTVATLRLELDNWTGHRFADLIHTVESRQRVTNHE